MLSVVGKGGAYTRLRQNVQVRIIYIYGRARHADSKEHT